ncbi:MAG: preprotein translocase subunit SecA [Clostridia bacterium]|nr:preprotein translocase subunit SecA [Clostridia bacterium]
MANSFLKKLFGDNSTRELKKLEPTIRAIEALADKYRAMTDEELKAETPRLKAKLAAGATLDDILPEAFAAFREACLRVMGQYPFRVQLIGGVVLHQGRIAEMKTGEGKTLTATLPAYLNALAGKGVHIITVNDYLASYQGELMGKIYRFMGVSCGVIIHAMSNDERRAAYACDITYGTNNELGFDYLRDNMAIYKENMVQRGHVFAIVDEIDSILIDEARTPLIISGQGDKSTDLYKIADRFAATLTSLKVVEVDEKQEQDDIEADYLIDEKARTATLTPHGSAKAERYFKLENLSDPQNAELLHHINQAVKARGCMVRDVDYVVRDGEIIIVDEFTGRLMFGRRYNEGLHQAIEAKENVEVKRESKTLATITFQNFFRLYSKLSGMTGTAVTEEDEFRQIYNLDVVEIPTNMPMIRNDMPDRIYCTQRGKEKAIVQKIKECYDKKQPVLVGTISIERSEQFSAMLKREGIRHQVLNAKHHEKEANIVAQAGKSGAVTIATNMAGRGTDIMLGGNAEYMAKDDLVALGYPDDVINEASGYADTSNAQVLEARAIFRQKLEEHKKTVAQDKEKVLASGGLCILGTERHESRRIDNQLRGRAGRQGDPGESVFMLSLEDDLMRLFGSERVMNMMRALRVPEDEALDQKILSDAIESAQKRVESNNFRTRINVLEYDNVMNEQRTLIYAERMRVLSGEDLSGKVRNMVTESISRTVTEASASSPTIERASAKQLSLMYRGLLYAPIEATSVESRLTGMTHEDAAEYLNRLAMQVYDAREAHFGAPVMREMERIVLLNAVDRSWMDHIDSMHELRRGIGLAGYAQVDPRKEYKRIGADMFDQMISSIRDETARGIFLINVQQKREKVAEENDTGDDGSLSKTVRKGNKVGRNDPCPCGSGKKYKHCCGK